MRLIFGGVSLFFHSMMFFSNVFSGAFFSTLESSSLGILERLKLYLSPRLFEALPGIAVSEKTHQNLDRSCKLRGSLL